MHTDPGFTPELSMCQELHMLCLLQKSKCWYKLLQHWILLALGMFIQDIAITSFPLGLVLSAILDLRSCYKP